MSKKYPPIKFPIKDRESYKVYFLEGVDFENDNAIFTKLEAYNIKSRELIQLQLIFNSDVLCSIMQTVFPKSFKFRKSIRNLKGGNQRR